MTGVSVPSVSLPSITGVASPGADRGLRVRVDSIDLLRGLVMVIMALDHTRDFVHSAAMAFLPEDLQRTTPAIFMTRWITHFCAPVFMFCAGLGISMKAGHGTPRPELARFLLIRGLWLIVIEFTVVRVAFFFEIGFDPLFLLVLWALGLSMIALAALQYLPRSAVLVMSVMMIGLHNLFDGLQPAQLGAFGWLWQLLHVQGVLTVNPTVIVAYPLVPWVGVMALGYAFGAVYLLPPQRRRRILVCTGLALTVAFVAIRALNGYGDPRPWSVQPTLTYTLLSFLNTTKYPPSLSFLLMTLGPALLFLAWADGMQTGKRNQLRVFGRVPLFYFILHIVVIHAAAVGMTLLRYGAAPFALTPPPTLGSPRSLFPPDYGWDLWVVYAVWAAVVLMMYPMCVWFMKLKDTRRSAWLRYM